MKLKAEARLDLLRQVGVAVETWLKSAMNQVMEELENECWNNLSGHDASLAVRATVPSARSQIKPGEAPICPSAHTRDTFYHLISFQLFKKIKYRIACPHLVT